MRSLLCGPGLLGGTKVKVEGSRGQKSSSTHFRAAASRADASAIATPAATTTARFQKDDLPVRARLHAASFPLQGPRAGYRPGPGLTTCASGLGRLAGVAGARPDEPAFLVLLEPVRDPAHRPADPEQRQRRSRRQPKRATERHHAEVDVRHLSGQVAHCTTIAVARATSRVAVVLADQLQQQRARGSPAG